MIAVVCGVAVGAVGAAIPQERQASFQSARPIWPEGRQEEMNLFVGFRTVFERPDTDRVSLRIAGSSLYRVTLNGQFLGHGPITAAHGYYRVDEWPLPDAALTNRNVLAIEVAGYNVNSFYLLDQPAFLQAEIVAGGKVLASTQGAGQPFKAAILGHRVQKVQRYSFQRPFIEYYRQNADTDAWKTDPQASFETTDCAVQPKKNLLCRGVSYPLFQRRSPVRIAGRGRFETGDLPPNVWKDRSLVNVGPQFKSYREEDLELVVSTELQRWRTTQKTPANEPYGSDVKAELGPGDFTILDLGTNLSGFIGATVTCKTPTTLYVTFDEILHDGDVNFRRLGCVNAVGYELQPGTYALESFEPYTLRYARFSVLLGGATIRNVYLREYVCDEASGGRFACSDERLNRIFEAARQTFRQNAVGVFMDCPSRERAGWLCDSFFTARVALDLTGNTRIEKNLYENYLLPDRFEHLPEGMLAMCYPADHYDGVFIPNWAMWFVIQMEEYLERSGDRDLVEALEPRVMALLTYLERFRNADGLLEKLESWVFVEWSEANKFVQDVNYPSNMLYAAVLAAAGRIYNKPALLDQAARIRKVILDQSFDGDFFVDNAVRKEGRLEVTRNRTEICQYFAFYFGLADPQSHPALWRILQDEFGPTRKETQAWPEIHAANAFIGNYLRLELLSRAGRCRQLKDELSGYFLYMAEQTGTLWENVGAYASCNHGFASHVAHCLYRDVLGVYAIDRQARTITLRIADQDLDFCRGTIPTPDGPITLVWHRTGDAIAYRLAMPAGYTVSAKAVGDIQLKREF